MGKLKLELDDKLISEVFQKGFTVEEAIANKYAEEIRAIKKNNESLKNASAFDILLRTNNLTPHSMLKDFNTSAAGSWLLPAYIDNRLRIFSEQQPLMDYVIKNRVTIPGQTIESAYLYLGDEKNKSNLEMARVAEGADLPLAEIVIGESAVMCHKYGRAVQTTYEAIQFLTAQVFDITLNYIASDITNSQLRTVINIIINGDGNKMPNTKLPNKAPTFSLATPSKITAEDLVDIVIEFQKKTNLPITTIIVGDEFYKQLFNLKYDVNMVGGVMNGFGIDFPQINLNDVNVIYSKDVPATSDGKPQMILLNNLQALIKYTSAGSNIRELDSNIRNQTRLGTISEITGFAKFNPLAAMVAF